MATFILFWNPAISSYKLPEYRKFLSQRPEYYDFNWSVWEHDKAKSMDEFYMVRCKNKPVPGKLDENGKQVWEPCIDETTGICMAGVFSSDPWEGEDWAGKGRTTYYSDLFLYHASDPDECVILSTGELMAAFPDFDWKGGHSGRELDEVSAEKLYAMFQKAVEEKKDKIWSQPLNLLID